MRVKDENIEAFSNICDGYDVNIPEFALKGIVEEFIDHLDIMRDMEMEPHRGGTQKCSSCERLKDEIKSLKEEIEIYQDSVKQRTSASSVWVSKATHTVRYDY